MIEKQISRRTLLRVGSATATAAFLGRRQILRFVGETFVGKRPERKDLTELLSPGVMHYRRVYKNPRPLVVDIVGVNLSAPNLELFVTPGDTSNGGEAVLRTTSQFYEMYRDLGLLFMVNGGYALPVPYPGAGEPVIIRGQVVSGGVEYSEPQDGFNVFYATRENGMYRVGIADAVKPEEVDIAIAGREIMVVNGKVQTFNRDVPDPRTIIGFSESPQVDGFPDTSGVILWIMVAGGRQPDYSEGLTKKESGAFMVEKLNVTNALNLDGGGSSALVIDGELVSASIEHNIPMLQRGVPNALGVTEGGIF